MNSRAVIRYASPRSAEPKNNFASRFSGFPDFQPLPIKLQAKQWYCVENIKLTFVNFRTTAAGAAPELPFNYRLTGFPCHAKRR